MDQKFYVMLVEVVIKKSIATAISKRFFAWELPVVQMRYGHDAIEIVQFKWRQKTFVDGINPSSEFNRMKDVFGSEENGMPYVMAIYGGPIQINQSLAPIMKKCLQGNEPKGKAKNPFGEMWEPEAAPDYAAEIPEGDDNDEAPDPLNTPDDPRTAELPPSLDTDGSGGVSKDEIGTVLVALGVDPDPSMSFNDMRAQLSEVLDAEILEYDGELIDDESLNAKYERFISLKN